MKRSHSGEIEVPSTLLIRFQLLHFGIQPLIDLLSLRTSEQTSFAIVRFGRSVDIVVVVVVVVGARSKANAFRRRGR